MNQAVYSTLVPHLCGVRCMFFAAPAQDGYLNHSCKMVAAGEVVDRKPHPAGGAAPRPLRWPFPPRGDVLFENVQHAPEIAQYEADWGQTIVPIITFWI